MQKEEKLFNIQQLLTSKEASEYLRMTENAFRIFASREKVPSYRLGKKSVRYKVEDLERLLTPINRRKNYVH